MKGKNYCAIHCFQFPRIKFLIVGMSFIRHLIFLQFFTNIIIYSLNFSTSFILCSSRQFNSQTFSFYAVNIILRNESFVVRSA